jgi:hypothetical protein
LERTQKGKEHGEKKCKATERERDLFGRESIWIKCCDNFFDEIYLFNLTVKLSASPVRDLIKLSP